MLNKEKCLTKKKGVLSYREKNSCEEESFQKLARIQKGRIA
jgi:hypothetical protein